MQQQRPSHIQDEPPQAFSSENSNPAIHPTEQPTPPIHQRFFLDLFAGHSALLTVAAKAAGIDPITFAISLMTINLKISNNLHILGLLVLLGQHHHVNFILSSDRTMEDHHLYDQKNTWMDYHKNPKRSIDDPLSYALLFSNKEVLLVKNNQSTLLPGVKLSTNSSYHNALVTSSPHLLVNGDSTGLRLGLSLAIAATSGRIKSLAAHCDHTDHQDFRGKRLPDGTSISAITAGYPYKLAHAIIDIIKPWVSSSTSGTQSLSTWKSLLSKKSHSKKGLALQIVQATTAQPIGPFLYLKTLDLSYPPF